MHPNDSFLHRPLFTSLEELNCCLNPAATQTLSQLTDVLLIPQDIPRLPIVLVTVCRAIETYGSTLRSPNATFQLVHSLVARLREDIIDRLGWTTSCHELMQPLLRRLLRHSPYAVCIAM